MISERLHYSTLSSETIEHELDSVYRRWHIAEREHDRAKEEYKETGEWPEYAPTARQLQRYADIADRMEEELLWRDDPQQVIDLYARQGRIMVYACHSGAWSTWDKAMSMARCLVMENDVYLTLGADGQGTKDMCKPEDMIQVMFIRKEEYDLCVDK